MKAPSHDPATERLLHFYAEPDLIPGNFDGADVSSASLARMARDGKDRSLGAEGAFTLRQRNLAGASLRLANLSGVDLSGADLSGIEGSGLICCGAQLDSANLEGADLAGANFSQVSAGEANFSEALVEDAKFALAQLRFANFTKAFIEGADLTEADLWGARLDGASANRAVFHKARLDEASLIGAELPDADLSRASLRRANLTGSRLRNANLQDALLDGANLTGADLSGASMPNLSLSTCDLRGAFFAGAWLERTRMRAAQFGDCVGEEASDDLEGSIDSYLVLERNFLSLGLAEDASWAYLRKRRVARRLHLRRARTHLRHRQRRLAGLAMTLWTGDLIAEWLCDYGESLGRVARAFVSILIVFAALYWMTGSLKVREGFSGGHLWDPVNYLLFSLNSMTTVGTSEVALRPRGELGVLMSSLQTVVGTILLGLFGFVLGARIRN